MGSLAGLASNPEFWLSLVSIGSRVGQSLTQPNQHLHPFNNVQGAADAQNNRLNSVFADLEQRLHAPITLPNAVVHDLPSFGGGDLPMTIGMANQPSQFGLDKPPILNWPGTPPPASPSPPGTGSPGGPGGPPAPPVGTAVPIGAQPPVPPHRGRTASIFGEPAPTRQSFTSSPFSPPSVDEDLDTSSGAGSPAIGQDSGDPLLHALSLLHFAASGG